MDSGCGCGRSSPHLPSPVRWRRSRLTGGRSADRRTRSMTFMLGALVLATLLPVTPRAAAAQTLSVLRIKVVLIDAERKPTPVARHALLISDNPPSAAPRRIVTALDGTAEVRLRPGNYTVESERPVAFQSKAYQWTQMVDIAAGRDAVLELTADNAEVDAAAPRPRPQIARRS